MWLFSVCLENLSWKNVDQCSSVLFLGMLATGTWIAEAFEIVQLEIRPKQMFAIRC